MDRIGASGPGVSCPRADPGVSHAAPRRPLHGRRHRARGDMHAARFKDSRALDRRFGSSCCADRNEPCPTAIMGPRLRSGTASTGPSTCSPTTVTSGATCSATRRPMANGQGVTPAPPCGVAPTSLPARRIARRVAEHGAPEVTVAGEHVLGPVLVVPDLDAAHDRCLGRVRCDPRNGSCRNGDQARDSPRTSRRARRPNTTIGGRREAVDGWRRATRPGRLVGRTRRARWHRFCPQLRNRR